LCEILHLCFLQKHKLMGTTLFPAPKGWLDGDARDAVTGKSTHLTIIARKSSDRPHISPQGCSGEGSTSTLAER
jgi:hypothetical protein